MKHILIVEDEPDIQELLRTYLEDAGYQTAVAGDGVAALALFGSQHFDLVLLDLMLPKIDGFGVCELIRQQSQVPILKSHIRSTLPPYCLGILSTSQAERNQTIWNSRSKTSV